jgi:hypothetical protein
MLLVVSARELVTQREIRFMSESSLVYHYTIVRYYNSVTRGERINVGIQVKDIKTGRCIQRIREDMEAIRGISPDITDSHIQAIKPFFGKSGATWQEDPGAFKRFLKDDESFAGAMSCNRYDKGGVGLGHMQRGCDNPKNLTTLEACLDNLFEQFCTPYKTIKDR